MVVRNKTGNCSRMGNAKIVLIFVMRWMNCLKEIGSYVWGENGV